MHGGQTLDVAAAMGVGMTLVSGYAKGDAIPLSRDELERAACNEA